jgi:hypothetical protein
MLEPPLNNIRVCDLVVIINLPVGAMPRAWKATVYQVTDPDLTPRMIVSVLAIRLEFWPDGNPPTADLLMADNGGKPLVLSEGGMSNEDSQLLTDLPRVWWRCQLAELRPLVP